MHWGHAVTSDLITYEEMPAALTPDDGRSYLGGSSIAANDRLYLFYTCDNEILSAVSEDGIHFTDTEFGCVRGDCDYFMDPHVFRSKDRYLMLVGTGRHNIAGISLYSSQDLISWEFVSELISDIRFGSHIESPNLFQTDDKWCLMFTSARQLPSRNICALGDFDGTSFRMEGDFFSVESGPDLYNPYVSTINGRNLMLGWFYDRKSTSGAAKGMLTCAREIELNRAGELSIMPSAELLDARLTTSDSSFVCYDNGRLKIMYEKKTIFDKAYRSLPDTLTVEDVATVEVFINGGVDNITITVC